MQFIMENDMRTHNGIQYDDRHGGPFDRGSADSWYSRGIQPHYYVGATAQSERIEGKDMTPEELTAYMAGYEYNEQFGGKKNYE
jgi:hypothetical protein